VEHAFAVRYGTTCHLLKRGLFLRPPRAWESSNFHAHFPEFAKLYLMSRRTPSRMNVHLRTHLMKLRTLSPRRHLLMMMEILFLTEAPSRSSI
jgi:hypothetical protein